MDAAGVGAVITKVISRKEHFPPAWIHGFPYRAVVQGDSWLLRGDPRLDLEYGVWLIKEARKRLSIPIIASMMGHADKVDIWVDNALTLQKAGAHALELDLFCPLERKGARQADSRPELDPGNPIMAHPDMVGRVVKGLTQALDIPIIPKLTPIGGKGIIEVAQACVANGAKTLTMANAMGGNAGVDIYKNGETLFPNSSPASFAIYLGKYLWPIHSMNLVMLSKALQGRGIPISSGGGVSTWEEIVQRIMLGANNVQLCSALYLGGRGVVKKCLNGLEVYLNEYGYKSINEIRSKGLVGIDATANGSEIAPSVAQIKKPLECLKCANPCVDKVTADCLAMTMGDDGVPKIDATKCTGCALCYWCCDSKAIDMIRTEKHVDYRVINGFQT
ncbi:MAG: hypothetical protein U1F35_11160 [Steroidobacteraceae bacterium]